MPKKKEVTDFRFWVRLDNQPELAQNIIDWAHEAGMSYPAEFIKVVLKRHAQKVAADMGLTIKQDGDKTK